MEFFIAHVHRRGYTKKLIPHTGVEDKHKQAFALFSLIHKLLSVLDANATIGARDALAL